MSDQLDGNEGTTDGADARRPTITSSTDGESRTSFDALLTAQRGMAGAILSAVRRRARVRLSVLGGLLTVALLVLWTDARRDDATQARSSRTIDSLAAVAAHQKAVLQVTQRHADSLERAARASAAQLLAHADAADRAPVPHVAIVPLRGSVSSSAAEDSGSSRAASAPYPSIDSTWFVVYAMDRNGLVDHTAPHYVDAFIAQTLARLDSLGVEYTAFRGDTRTTVNQLLVALDSVKAVAIDAQHYSETLEGERDAARALVPTPAQQLWHDTKVVALTVGLLKAASWIVGARK